MNSFLLSLFLLAATPKSLQDLRQNFQNYKEFKVSFTQEVKQELFPGKTQKAEGHLEFRRPHFMKWVYLKPEDEKKEIIYDGKDLKILRNGELEVAPKTSEISLEESFAFLWGQSDSRHFDVEAVSDTEFLLKPKKKDAAQFQSIRFQVKQGVVEKALVTDLLDGQSELSFHNWRFESKAK